LPSPTNLSVVPEPTTIREVGHLVDAIAPILKGYWSHPGMYEAIDRLRDVAMWRVGWVEQARRARGWE